MKILNRRVILFLSVSLLLGVFLGKVLESNRILLIVIPLAIAVGGMILLSVTKKPLIFALFFALVLGIAIINVDDAFSYGMESDLDATISCRVENKEQKDRYRVTDLTVNGKKVNGKSILYTASDLEIGEELYVTGHIKSIETDIYNISTTGYYCDRIYYKITNATILAEQDGKKTITEKTKEKIYDGIDRYIEKQNAGVMKSLLFGDKSQLDISDKEMINGIGLAHIFAVSGLHIGFIAGILLLLFRKFKLNHFLSLGIVVGILLFYGGMTGFSSGVKRAIIMFTVSSLALPLGQKNDPLTSLALSAGLVVLTNPRELFDIGFLMSMAAVLGIVCFYKPLYNWMKGKTKNRVLHFFMKVASTTVSANLFIIPISFNVFNSISLYSFFANLIILPIITIVFPFAAISAILSLITIRLGVLFYILGFFIDGIRSISLFIYSLPFSVIRVSALQGMTVFYVAAFCILSPYCLLQKKYKYIASGSCAVLCFVLLFL